jgi:hypothetical protein
MKKSRDEALTEAVRAERDAELRVAAAWGEVRRLTRELSAAKQKRRWWIDHKEAKGKK